MFNRGIPGARKLPRNLPPGSSSTLLLLLFSSMRTTLRIRNVILANWPEDAALEFMQMATVTNPL